MKIYGTFINKGTINDIHDNEQVMVSDKGIQVNRAQAEVPDSDQLGASHDGSITQEVRESADAGRDAEIAAALTALMEVRDAKGDYLFSMNSQWMAVYRILVDYRGWLTEYRGFVRRVNEMGHFRIPCTEDAVKRIDDIFAKPFVVWDIHKYHGQGAVFRRQYNVALKLMEILRISMENME